MGDGNPPMGAASTGAAGGCDRPGLDTCYMQSGCIHALAVIKCALKIYVTGYSAKLQLNYIKWQMF